MPWALADKGGEVRILRKRAALAVAVLALAACGGSATPTTSSSSGASTSPPSTGGATPPTTAGISTDPGVTSTTIVLGQIADVSGPIPGLFSGAVNGLDAWAAYVNSTGGIDGRKVVIDHMDSALSCTAYTNEIQKLVRTAFAIVGTTSAVDVCGVATIQANPAVPMIQAFFIDNALSSYPNVFSPPPTPPGNSTTGYQWVKNKYGLAAVEKTAALYPSDTAENHVEQTAAAESVGYKEIYSRGVGNSETNFTSDVLRMKAEGVEIVDFSDFPVNDVADFLQQAAQQDFHPAAVISITAYDASFFKLLGNTADAGNVIMPLPYVLYLGQDAASVPAVGTMATWLQTAHPGSQANLYSLYGWASGVLFQQAMSKAGSTPSRAQLLTALNGVTSFTANGLLSETNPGQKKPSTCIVIAGVKNGQYVRIDPPTSGFECESAGYFYYHKAS